MNRNQAKTLSPIIKAFSEGKNIQSRCIKGDTSLWYDDEDPSFDDDFEYRIKSEPKYRPFKDAEECWQEMLRHEPFGWVKMKTSTKTIHYIVELNGNSDHPIEFKRHSDSLKGMFGAYTFADGVPFGVKIEE